MKLKSLLIGTFALLGIFFGILKLYAFNNLPFGDNLTGMFLGIENNYTPVHFNYGGNDFVGIIFWTTKTTLSSAQNLSIDQGRGGLFQSINCSGKLEGIYYNNQRGRRIWPLDTGSLQILQSGDSSYDDLTMSGGFFTDCYNISGYENISGNEVYGQIRHNRSGTNFSMIAGIDYDFSGNIQTGDLFSGSLKISNSIVSGRIFDSQGGIGLLLLSGSLNYCGDGTTNTGEQCDDGNAINLDGCNSSCQLEYPSCTILNNSPKYSGDLVTFTGIVSTGSKFININFGDLFSGTRSGTYTGTTSTGHAYIQSGSFESMLTVSNILSGSFTGMCTGLVTIQNSGTAICTSFTGTPITLYSGENIIFTCTGNNVQGYRLNIFLSGNSTAFYTDTQNNETANSYTRTINNTRGGNTFPIGNNNYIATCTVLGSGNSTGPQCGNNVNFTVINTGICSDPNFQGELVFNPSPYLISTNGYDYYSSKTGITVNIKSSIVSNFYSSGDFSQGILSGISYTSFSGYNITLNNINTGNYFHTTFTTGACGPYLDYNDNIFVDMLPPPAITGSDILSGICSSGTINLNWNQSIDTGVGFQKYTREISSNTGFVGIINGDILTGSTTGISINANLLSGTTRYRRVKSIDLFGRTTTSTSKSFTLGAQYCEGISTGCCSACLCNSCGGISIRGIIPRIRNAYLNKAYMSDPFVVEGLSGSQLATVSKGILYVNGTGIGVTGMINSGDELNIEMISSNKYDTTVSSEISIGGKHATFNVTTKMEGDSRGTCSITDSQKESVEESYTTLKANYEDNSETLKEFLQTTRSMLKDNIDITQNCSLRYMIELIEGDLDNRGGGGGDTKNIDTSLHTAPNCKKYGIGYDYDKQAYYSISMQNRYFFLTRDSLVRHIDYYNAGDCHINTYENDYGNYTNSGENEYIAPNGKIYTINQESGKFTSPEFSVSKYFDSLNSIQTYIKKNNPAKSIRDHRIDTTFTPMIHIAPNGKEYKIYKTDRGYMSYKLMSQANYHTSLDELINFIDKKNKI